MYARIFSRIPSGSIGFDSSAGGIAVIPRGSAVKFRGDDVQATQDRDDIRDQVVLDDERKDLEVDERGRSGPGPPGDLAAVGHQVIAKLTVWALHPRVDLID